LASQRVTIAKIGGLAADVALQRLREWSAARLTHDPNEWSPGQWPQHVREKADAFADQLRAHAFTPPVVHFVEWADTWSMGDLFARWLTPPDGPAPVVVYADRHTIFAYALPDGGHLAQHLATAGPQQWEEADWFIGRLREAVGAWDQLVERSALVVLRSVVGPSASDEEVTASLRTISDWLS
jgi:hypothetical protein